MKNPIKPNFKTEISSIAMIIFSIISSFILYSNMPTKIPVHWNFKGEIDRFGNSFNHLIFINSLLIIMYLLFLVLPKIDPRKKRYEQFIKTYHTFKNLIIFFLGGILFITNLNAVGKKMPIGIYIPIAVGLLFMIIGNYMAKIKMNWFMGIKTPWTLSSEEVWNKTHRLGGKLFMISGALIMINGFLPENFRIPIFILSISIILIGTIGGSYIIYKKINK